VHGWWACERKQGFFLKKEAKTFAPLSRTQGESATAAQKFFGSFFLKKNGFS
jgi:hypothetical protein